MAAVKKKGLDLPPVVGAVAVAVAVANGEYVKKDGSAQKPAESEVGKGLFDGW